MLLSVIIPAYNESDNLEGTVRDIIFFLKKRMIEYEVIIVNDCSSDDTGRIAVQLKQELPNIKIITHERNRGKGASVRIGLLQAKGNIRMFMDADNATSIDHLDLALPLINNGYGIVIGSRSPRDVKETTIIKAQPIWKTCLGKTGNLLFQALAVRGIWDTQCGFKVFEAAVAQKIMPMTKTDRWAIDVEILLIARRTGIKIGIIPVCWKNSEQSRVGIKGYFIALKELLFIRLGLIGGSYGRKGKK